MGVLLRPHLFEPSLVSGYPLVQLGLPDDIFCPMAMLRRNQRIRHQKSHIIAGRGEEQPDHRRRPEKHHGYNQSGQQKEKSTLSPFLDGRAFLGTRSPLHRRTAR
ncbi:hypothetical protein D3C74_245940 [compost metagenome]